MGGDVTGTIVLGGMRIKVRKYIECEINMLCLKYVDNP